ncbi:MAG: SURF1 family protein [Spirochaetales bacterium]|nr:SURF1 family protein [Spirochaetales bacterium]
MLALAVALTCFVMSHWQFKRYGEKKEFFARLKDVDDATPLRPGENYAFGSKLKVEGQFLPEPYFLLMNRSYQSQPGAKYIGVLKMSEGLLLIDRGWIPLQEVEKGDLDRYALPGDQVVQLIGLVRHSKEGRTFLSPPENMGEEGGRIKRWFRMNVSAMQGQLDRHLLPYYLEQVHWKTDPLPKEQPLPLASEILPPGRHLNYTMQWISFGLFALVVGILWQFRPRRKPVLVTPAHSP